MAYYIVTYQWIALNETITRRVNKLELAEIKQYAKEGKIKIIECEPVNIQNKI